MLDSDVERLIRQLDSVNYHLAGIELSLQVLSKITTIEEAKRIQKQYDDEKCW